MRLMAAINRALMLAGSGEPTSGMILREEVEATGRAFEDAEVPIAVLFQASGRLDHRSTAVRACGGFAHNSKSSALDLRMFRFLLVSRLEG